MKAGRRALKVGDYANARAVESAMISLTESGREWATPREIIAELRNAQFANPRVVWNRGRARLLGSDRLEVRAELDGKKRGVERYKLRFVEGRAPQPISLAEFQALPEEVRRFYRPLEKSELEASQGSGIFRFLDILNKIATPVVVDGLTFQDLLEETSRRRRIWEGTFEFETHIEKHKWEERRREPEWWPTDIQQEIGRLLREEVARRPEHRRAARRTPSPPAASREPPRPEPRAGPEARARRKPRAS